MEKEKVESARERKRRLIRMEHEGNGNGRLLKSPFDPTYFSHSLDSHYTKRIVKERRLARRKKVKVKPVKQEEVCQVSLCDDDDDGNLVVYQGSVFRNKYLVKGIIGQGVYGKVYECVVEDGKKDHGGSIVAIKVLKSGKVFRNSGEVEKNFLMKLGGSGIDFEEYKIVRLLDSFELCSHLCLVFELLGKSIGSLLRKEEQKGLEVEKIGDYEYSCSGLDTKIVRRLSKQILQCLCCLSNHKIIHRDLKPENILLLKNLEDCEKEEKERKEQMRKEIVTPTSIEMESTTPDTKPVVQRFNPFKGKNALNTNNPKRKTKIKIITRIDTSQNKQKKEEKRIPQESQTPESPFQPMTPNTKKKLFIDLSKLSKKYIIKVMEKKKDADLKVKLPAISIPQKRKSPKYKKGSTTTEPNANVIDFSNLGADKTEDDFASTLFKNDQGNTGKTDNSEKEKILKMDKVSKKKYLLQRRNEVKDIIEDYQRANSPKVVKKKKKKRKKRLLDKEEMELQKYEIRVIDFGSAEYYLNIIGKKKEFYVQSRIYRAPEIILGHKFQMKMDVWSAGVIAFEMFFGVPPFIGKDDFHQLTKIVRSLGTPPKEFLDKCQFVHKFFDLDKEKKTYQLKSYTQYFQSKKMSEKEINCTVKLYEKEDKKFERLYNGKTIHDIVTNKPFPGKMLKEVREKEEIDRIVFMDFLGGVLNVNPKERLSANQAICHPFLTGVGLKNDHSGKKGKRQIDTINFLLYSLIKEKKSYFKFCKLKRCKSSMMIEV